MVDGDDAIKYWVRLQTGDLPIAWTDKGRQYNPDFIVRDKAGDDWLVEVKMDKEAKSEEVQAKREAAKRWVNRVNNSRKFPNKWHYLLVTETDVNTAKGSWAAVRQLGS
jgi:type III restriction enzyme